MLPVRWVLVRAAAALVSGLIAPAPFFFVNGFCGKKDSAMHGSRSEGWVIDESNPAAVSSTKV